MLAEKAGVSHTCVVRIETGDRGLSVEMAEKFGEVLGVSAAVVLALDGNHPERDPEMKLPQGLAEDVTPFDFADATPVSLKTSARQRVTGYELHSNCLDALGFLPHDILLIDMDRDAIAAVDTGKCVLVEVFCDQKPKLYVRQYVAPALLITNSHRHNEASISLDIGDVAIKGVVIGSFRPALR